MKLLVFAPGIMGSILRADKKIWPPKVSEVIGGYKRVDELLRNDLTVGGIIPKVGFFDVYSTLLNDIRSCGYEEDDSTKRFLPFPYDWRRGNVESTKRLAEALDQATAGIPADDLEIFLLGHSMGGLLFRQLIESGLYSERTWYRSIKWVVFLGTPHNGAAVALHRLAGKEGVLGVSGEDIKKLANDSQYPSLFELVGPTDSALTTTTSFSNRIPEALSPFSPSLASALNMNPDNIRVAEEFWESIDHSKKPDSVDYYAFVSASHTTIVSNESSVGGTDLLPIRRSESGDGTVSIPSAVLPSEPHGYSSKKHQKIFLDRKVRRHLFRLLEAPDGLLPQSAPSSAPTDTPDAIGLSLNQESFAEGEPIELGVSFTTPQTDPSVSFTIQELAPESGEKKEDGFTHDFRIAFRGISVTEFRSIITPQVPVGVFELVSSTTTDDAEPTMFFIRDPESE